MPNIFSRLFKPKVDNNLSSSRSFFLSKASSGVDVTERTALQTAAVYACVRVIAEAIASLPLKLYEYKGNGTQICTEHPLYDILHIAPNPEMTSFLFRETMMSHLLLWGNAYAQIIRDGLGQVTALYLLLPNKITMNRDEHGEIYYTYQLDTDERLREKGGVGTFRNRMSCTFRGIRLTDCWGIIPSGFTATQSAWR